MLRMQLLLLSMNRCAQTSPWVLLICTVVSTAWSISVGRSAFDWNIHPAVSRQSLYLNNSTRVSSSSAILPVLSILIESFAAILLCLEFAFSSPEHFFKLLFWDVRSWDFVCCALRRFLMENISAQNTLSVLKDFGCRAREILVIWEWYSHTIYEKYGWESPTWSQRGEIYSSSTYQWCLIPEKGWDVNSGGWFNTLVNFIALSWCQCWNSILEYCSKIELLLKMESPIWHLRI